MLNKLKHPYFLFFITIVANGIFNAHFQLHYDEAYYWVWGQNLSLSYFDHPPMIAYMMRLASFLGYSEFFVRLPALVSGAVMLIIMYKLAKEMFDGKVATIAAYLGISWPLLQGVFLVTTPDSPLIMFWMLTLYSFYLGVFKDNKKQIYLSGFWLGCTLLSKYTGVLIIPGLFLFLLFSNKYRNTLYRKDLYCAVILAFCVASPIFIWNYHHDWVSFKFQIAHGYDYGKNFRGSSFGDFLVSQFGVAGPFMSLAMLYYFSKNVRIILANDLLAFLFWPFLCIFVFFAHGSFYAYSGANWTMPGFISAFILLAYWLAKNNNKWVYKSSLVLILIATIMIKLPAIFLPRAIYSRVSAISVFYGNHELANKVRSKLVPGTLLLACDYGNASRLWYYLGNNRRVYVLSKFKFANNYAYWNKQLNLTNATAVFVCDKPLKQNTYNELATYFNVDDTNMCLTKMVYANELYHINSTRYSLINSGNKLWLGSEEKIYYVNKTVNDFSPLDLYFQEVKLIEKAEVKGFFAKNLYFIYRASNKDKNYFAKKE